MINFKFNLNLYSYDIIYHLYIVYKKLLINIIIYIICFLIGFYNLLYFIYILTKYIYIKYSAYYFNKIKIYIYIKIKILII